MAANENQIIAFEVPASMAVVDGIAVIRYMDDEGKEAFRIAEFNEPGDVTTIGLLRSAVALRESEIEGFDYDG